MRFLALFIVACLAAGGAQAKQLRRPAKAQSGPETSAAPVGDANGAWALESSTTVGNCPGLIPSSVQIVDGKIVATSEMAVAAWGYVDDAGTIVARFTAGGEQGQGERVARIHGTLRSGKGSGAWSSSTDMCGGTWRAARTGEATAAAPAPAQAEQPAPPDEPALIAPFN
jgi:hypothetical protein